MPQNFERRIRNGFTWNVPDGYLNSVNERQNMRGANPEQRQKQTIKQTQTFRCHVAQEQSLAVEKKHNFVRLKV